MSFNRTRFFQHGAMDSRMFRHRCVAEHFLCLCIVLKQLAASPCASKRSRYHYSILRYDSASSVPECELYDLHLATLPMPGPMRPEGCEASEPRFEFQHFDL